MAEQRKRMAKPAAVSGLLAGIFRGKPLEKRLREGKIWLVWDRAVGKQIAAKAQPAKFQDGVLTVTVSNAPWMQQLTFLKREIIAKLNNVLGEGLVRDIYLKAGKPERSRIPLESARPPRAELSARDLEWVEEQTAAIEDLSLREVFRKILVKHLQSRA